MLPKRCSKNRIDTLHCRQPIGNKHCVVFTFGCHDCWPRVLCTSSTECFITFSYAYALHNDHACTITHIPEHCLHAGGPSHQIGNKHSGSQCR